MGRFMAIDSVVFVESSPQSFNRNAYANNPYRFIDPKVYNPTAADVADLPRKWIKSTRAILFGQVYRRKLWA